MGLTISINDQAAFNVVIGVPGPQGIPGPTGPAGAGIIPGGTAGQLLSKIDSTNYNTQWADPILFTGGPITSAITLTLGSGNFFTGLFDREVYGVDYTDGSFFDVFNNGIYTGNDALGYMGMSTDGLRFTDGSVQTTAASLFTGGPITSAITYTDGSGVTGFESGSFYVNRTDGYSAALQLNSLSLSSDTQSIGIAAAGITFADATFQSTAALPFTGGEVANPITMHDGSSDSEMSASVFGVELTSDTTQAASLSYTGLNVQISGSAMNVTATGITFPDSTTQTTAYTGGGGGPFLPLSGGTMTGAIVFDGTSGQYINKGNFDTSRGGNYGISLVCSIGYEFNWQAGWLTTTEQGSTTPRPLYIDSLAGTTLRAWDSATNTGTEVGHTGINVGNTSPYYVNVGPDLLKVFESTNELGVTIAHDSIAIQHIDTPNVTGYFTNEYIGFEDLSGTPHSAFVEHDVITVQDATDTTQMRSTGISLSANGAITFGDSTTQTTSATNLGYITQGTADTLYYPISSNPSGFIADATSDGQTYGRNNGAWTVVGGGSPAWGSITGTLSSQTDLQSALDAKYDASNPSSFITQGTADGLYYGISNPSNFVDGSYVSSALTGYATESFVTGQGYINQTTADGLYYSITNPSSFITQGTADTLYYSITNPSGFVDGTFVTSQGYINQTTADSLYYSISNPSSFITQGTADGLYYPLSTNPSGFVDGTYVTTALTGYATESFVTSQGYVDSSYVSNALIGYVTESYLVSQGYVDASYVSTALYGYATESFVTSQGFITQTTADGLYYPQTNPNNFITPPSPDGSNYVWQYYGWTALDLTGFVGPAPVDGTSYNRTDNAWTQNITFADNTVQTTAAVSGIPEAPVDGNYYVRKDGAWVQCTVVSIYDSNTSTSYNCLTV